MRTIQERLAELSEILDEDTVLELLEIFETQFYDLINYLEMQTEKPDLLEVSRRTHKVKSSARNVFAENMGNIFENLEHHPEDFRMPKYSSQALQKEYLEFMNLLGNWRSALRERKKVC